MSWLGKRVKFIYWIGLIIVSALFLISCEDPNDVGLEIVPPQDNLGVRFIDLPVQGTNTLVDSINTTNRGLMLSGKFEDDLFGSVKAQFYTRVFPESRTPNIPAEITESDSVILEMGYSYFHGLDFNGPQTFTVHALSEVLVDTATHYSFETTAAEIQSLGDTTLIIDPEIDSVLTINLNFLNDVLLTATQSFDPDDPSEFFDIIKGITVVPDETNTAIFGFNPNDPKTEISLYYTTDDTVSNAVTYRLGFAQYNNIQTDRSNTPLAGLLVPHQEYEDPEGKIYLQAGTGLTPKLNLQAYQDFINEDTTGTIVVNGAEILFKKPGGIGTNLDPPNDMSFYFTDDTNLLIPDSMPGNIQNNETYIAISQLGLDPLAALNQSSIATYDTTTFDYQADITMFLQLVADGELQPEVANELLVYPFSSVSNGVNLINNGLNLDRFVVDQDDISLRIYYTFLR